MGEPSEPGWHTKVRPRIGRNSIGRPVIKEGWAIRIVPRPYWIPISTRPTQYGPAGVDAAKAAPCCASSADDYQNAAINTPVDGRMGYCTKQGTESGHCPGTLASTRCGVTKPRHRRGPAIISLPTSYSSPRAPWPRNPLPLDLRDTTLRFPQLAGTPPAPESAGLTEWRDRYEPR